MNERRRWLDSDDVGDDVRTLLRAAPLPRSMTPAERARSARTLRRIAAIPIAAGMMFWIKNVAIAGLLGAAGGLVVSGAVVLSQDSPPEVGQRSEPKAVAPPATTQVVPREAPRAQQEPRAFEPEPLAAKRMPALPSASASAGPSPPAPDSLAAEAQKLERARAALVTSPARALDLLDESAREFPKGKLAAERELLMIDALGRLGRTGEARIRAERMLEQHRGGLYEDRLRRILSRLP